MTWKKVVNSDAGDADHFGGNDVDKISDLFSGVAAVDTVDIASDFTLRNQRLKLLNPAGTFTSTVTNPAVTANTAIELLYSAAGAIEIDINELNFRRVRMFERDPAIGEGANLLHITSSLAGGGPSGTAVYPKEDFGGANVSTNQTISGMFIFATDYLAGGIDYDALDIQAVRLAGSGEGTAKYQIISILDGTGFKHPIEIGMYSGNKMIFNTDNTINFSTMALSNMVLGTNIDFDNFSGVDVGGISNSVSLASIDLTNSAISVSSYKGSVASGITVRPNPNSTDATERSFTIQSLNATSDTYTSTFQVVPSGASPLVYSLIPHKFDSYEDIKIITIPSDPASGYSRLYAKQVDSNNDGLFVKLKINGAVTEVQIA